MPKFLKHILVESRCTAAHDKAEQSDYILSFHSREGGPHLFTVTASEHQYYSFFRYFSKQKLKYNAVNVIHSLSVSTLSWARSQEHLVQVRDAMEVHLSQY